jgi:hypothetical protein
MLAIAAAVARRRDGWTLAWWAAAAALAGIAGIRSAAWVVWPSVTGAAALGALAAGGGAAWREVASGLLRAFHLPGGWALVGRSAVAVRPASHRGSRELARGGAIGAGLLGLFVPLFASADAAFAHLLGEALPQGSVDRPVARIAAWALVAGGGGALLRAATAAPSAPAGTAPPTGRLARLEWLVPLGLLVTLFAAFVALQLTTLYGGDAHVLRTAGLSYAEYARQGFAQLIAAAALTLAVVAGAVRWARRASRDDEELLRGLLAALCTLTLVVLASALTRLGLYESAFGFTRLRLAAHAEILWLGGLFVLVLAAGASGRAGWLPRGVVGLSAVALLAFALADPDRRIVEHNVDRFERTGVVDLGVLAGLSPDATPALAALPRSLQACATWRVRESLERPDGLAGTNLARARARSALRGLSSRAGWPSDCTQR